MEDRMYFYINIIIDVLSVLCKGMEELVGFMCIIYKEKECYVYPVELETQYNNISKRWFESFNIDKKEINLICYIKNEEAFKAQMGISFYDEKNKSFPMFDLLMQRILKDIAKIILEDMKNRGTTTYYKGDKEILLLQSVIDFFVDHELPEISFITYISSLKYENNPCHGKILFADDIHSKAPIFLLKFEKTIEFNNKNERLIRKLLEVTGENIYLLADTLSGKIVGIINGINNSDSNNQYILKFCGHMHWILKYGDMTVVEFANGRYYIADDFNPKRDYILQLKECFRGFSNTQLKIRKSLELIQISQKQMHGTMIVVSNQAYEESNRLCSKQRGIKINPIDILDNKELFYSMTSIDGALLLDEDFKCHAFGVILDGPAADGDCSRGARYNSALTYCKWKNQERYQTWAIVISEDKMVNIVR